MHLIEGGLGNTNNNIKEIIQREASNRFTGEESTEETITALMEVSYHLLKALPPHKEYNLIVWDIKRKVLENSLISLSIKEQIFHHLDLLSFLAKESTINKE